MKTHPIMAQAIAPFAAPRKPDDSDALRRKLDALKSDWQSLLRLPFEVEVQTRGADRNGPAEYDFVYADDDDVRDAVDALIDRHIDELEADVKWRMQLRAEADV
jgi:hypothetical protein